MEKQNTQHCKSCIIQATAVRSKLLLSQVSGLCNVDGNRVLKSTLHFKERMAAILLDFYKILVHFYVISSVQNLVSSVQRHLHFLDSNHTAKAFKLVILCNIFVETLWLNVDPPLTSIFSQLTE